MRRDLGLHFVAGGLVGLVFTMVGYMLTSNNMLATVIGCVAALAVGAAKEVYDFVSGKGTPEFIDAGFTFLGGICGSFSLFFLRIL